MTEEVHPAWWKPWNWPWTVWGLVVVLMLALVPFVVRAVFLSSVPAMAEPFDAVAFVGDEIPSAENAFTEYRKAVLLQQQVVEHLSREALQNRPIVSEDFEVVYKGGWEAADEAMRAWVDDHRPALVLWRRGAEKDRALDHSPATMIYSTHLAASQELRSFVRLALVDQMRCLHEGDVEEAWKLARACYRSGGHASRRGPFIAGLIGISIHAMSSGGMQRWAEHPAVTTEQLRAALAQIRIDLALYESESNLLKVEYLVLRNSLTTPGWVSEIGDVLGGPISDGIMPSPVTRGFLWVVGEPELTIRISRQIVANQIREVDLPLSERRTLTGTGFAMLFDTDPAVTRAPDELDANGIDRGVTTSILAKLLLPAMKQGDNAVLRFRGRQAALEVLLAAQAYRRDKGEFPENLDALVPHYLEAIPLDPCDRNGGRLLYRRDSATSAVVWSVDYDGNDDGGAVENTNPNSRPADVGFVLKAVELAE